MNSDGNSEQVSKNQSETNDAIEVAETQEISQVVAEYLSIHISSPVPPPALLQAYNKINPKYADRIFRLIEAEGEHRRKMEWEGLRRANREVHIGQVLGFLLGGFIVACGTYAAIHGYTVSGSLIGTGGVVGIVFAFIYGSRGKSPPKQGKSEDES